MIFTFTFKAKATALVKRATKMLQHCFRTSWKSISKTHNIAIQLVLQQLDKLTSCMFSVSCFFAAFLEKERSLIYLIKYTWMNKEIIRNKNKSTTLTNSLKPFGIVLKCTKDSKNRQCSFFECELLSTITARWVNEWMNSNNEIKHMMLNQAYL